MREEFRDIVCEATVLVRLALSLVFILLLLSLYGLFFVSPGTGGYYLSMINFAVLGTLLIGAVGLLRWCSKKERKYVGDYGEE